MSAKATPNCGSCAGMARARRLLDELTLPQENLGASYSAHVAELPLDSTASGPGRQPVAVPVAGAFLHRAVAAGCCDGDLTYVTDVARIRRSTPTAPLRPAAIRHGSAAAGYADAVQRGCLAPCGATFSSPAKPQYDSQVSGCPTAAACGLPFRLSIRPALLRSVQ